MFQSAQIVIERRQYRIVSAVIGRQDAQRARIPFIGIGKTPGEFAQHPQIVAAPRRLIAAGSVQCFSQGQRAQHQRFGFGEATFDAAQARQIADGFDLQFRDGFFGCVFDWFDDGGGAFVLAGGCGVLAAVFVNRAERMARGGGVQRISAFGLFKQFQRLVEQA